MIKLMTPCRKNATLLAGLLFFGIVLYGDSVRAQPFITQLQEQPLVERESSQNGLPLPLAPAKPSPQLSGPTAQVASAESEDFELLLRGPLHEAFGEVYQRNPEPGDVVSATPPERIEELPPEYKPDGVNVEWIPGYWAWIEDDKDFIWVSGVWREVPPNQRWISGYWEQLDTGFRWISGFWSAVDVQELSYLPQPPESIDAGPAYPAPSEQHFYIPGCWVNQNNNYLWQPGYWAPRVENWVWIPSRYIWTPHGCLYRAGYWDREFADRGTVFAPVQYHRPVYQQAQYVYQPSCVIDTGYDFMVHLFLRPNQNQYWFGDWYGPQYSQRNYYSWVDIHHRAGWYDPMFAYYSYSGLRYGNSRLISHLGAQFQFYYSNQNYRPRHNYRDQIGFSLRLSSNDSHRDYVQRASYGHDYRNYAKDSHHGHSYQKVQPAQLAEIRGRIEPQQQSGNRRREFETGANPANDHHASARTESAASQASTDKNGQQNRSRSEFQSGGTGQSATRTRGEAETLNRTPADSSSAGGKIAGNGNSGKNDASRNRESGNQGASKVEAREGSATAVQRERTENIKNQSVKVGEQPGKADSSKESRQQLQPADKANSPRSLINHNQSVNDRSNRGSSDGVSPNRDNARGTQDASQLQRQNKQRQTQVPSSTPNASPSSGQAVPKSNQSGTTQKNQTSQSIFNQNGSSRQITQTPSTRSSSAGNTSGIQNRSMPQNSNSSRQQNLGTPKPNFSSSNRQSSSPTPSKSYNTGNRQQSSTSSGPKSSSQSNSRSSGSNGSGNRGQSGGKSGGGKKR